MNAQHRKYGIDREVKKALLPNGATDSERTFCLQTQEVARSRMPESEALGVQIEAVPGIAVERIAHDGAGKSFGVGTMQAKLVRTSRVGLQLQAADGATFELLRAHHLVLSDSGFSGSEIHHLARTVEQVGR